MQQVERAASMTQKILVYRAGALLALFLLIYAGVVLSVDYRPAFDDPDHIASALHWARTGTLAMGEFYLRVPLWQVLLGTSMKLTGSVHGGIFLIQAVVVLGVVLIHARSLSRLEGSARWWHLFPALLLVTSPQVVLYARHAVNEPLLGLIAVAIMALGVSTHRLRFLAIGALCGAAAMTKLAAAAMVLPALGYLWVTPGSRSRRLLQLALGAAAVVTPLYLLHLVQRGTPFIDTTSAYNLSAYGMNEWLAFGDHMERYQRGMANWRIIFFTDPGGYLRDVLIQLGHWLVRPTSLDFGYFFDAYPLGLLATLDSMVTVTLLVLALAGTRREHAAWWLFMLIIALACTFPYKTPTTPKIILLYPMLMMAPHGIVRCGRILRSVRARSR